MAQEQLLQLTVSSSRSVFWCNTRYSAHVPTHLQQFGGGSGEDSKVGRILSCCECRPWLGANIAKGSDSKYCSRERSKYCQVFSRSALLQCFILKPLHIHHANHSLILVWIALLPQKYNCMTYPTKPCISPKIQ